MKIDQIRDAIASSKYSRLDLTGHTHDELSRADVPKIMDRHIGELKALDIAPRYREDQDRRVYEITTHEALIRRWKEV